MNLTATDVNIRNKFIELNTALKKFKPWNSFPSAAPDNQKLKSSASRVTVPSRFEPFIKIIESRTSFRFTGDFEIKVENVRKQDAITIKTFASKNFDYSKLNLDILVRAASQSAFELGIKDVLIEKTDTLLSAKSFPSSSSSCYPLYRKKGDDDAISNAVQFAEEFLDNPEPDYSKLFSQITTLFHRYQYKVDQFGNVTPKIRAIWGIPFGVSVIEGFFFRHTVDSVSTYLTNNHSAISSLGRDLVTIGNEIISKFRIVKQILISLDLKAFDSTVPSFMWALFFATISPYYNIEDRYRPHFYSLMFYYCYTPYLYGNSDISYQRKGTPSGCLITALFNTWVNRTIINYGYLEQTDGARVPGQDLCVLGDDNLFPTDVLSLEYVTSLYEKFGMQVNTEKTELSSSDGYISFLGYIWDKQNRATQKENWFITHICLPSSFAINLDIPVSLYQTYRAISVCMPLYNGYSMFMKLIGFQDKVFKELYDNWKTSGIDPTIRYITNDKRYQNITFPLSLFVNGSWNKRSSLVSTEVD